MNPEESLSTRPSTLNTRLWHGADYNYEQWLHAPDVLDEDFRLMQLSGCNTFAVGIFAWTSYEQSDGQYDFGWLDRIMQRMADAVKRNAVAQFAAREPVAEGGVVGERHDFCDE